MGLEVSFFHLGENQSRPQTCQVRTVSSVSTVEQCDGSPRAPVYLEGQIVVLLFLLGPQCVPPLPQNLAHGPVVLVWVPLVDQRPVTLTENHERIHGSPDVVLLPLSDDKHTSHHITSHTTCDAVQRLKMSGGKHTFPGLVLSPSLGRALRD